MRTNQPSTSPVVFEIAFKLDKVLLNIIISNTQILVNIQNMSIFYTAHKLG